MKETTRLPMKMALCVRHRKPIRVIQGALAWVPETATAGASTEIVPDVSEG